MVLYYVTYPALTIGRGAFAVAVPASAVLLLAWRELLGGYFTEFLQDVKNALTRKGMTLSVGVPRGDVIGPPLGNWTLQWRRWIEEGIVDELVIDQKSSQCPSMWHQLWPMHRGYGYLHNYIDGKNLDPLEKAVTELYAPVLEPTDTRLHVARQWHVPDAEVEARILSLPSVEGLVFSTFRFDNPGSVARGNFRA